MSSSTRDKLNQVLRAHGFDPSCDLNDLIADAVTEAPWPATGAESAVGLSDAEMEVLEAGGVDLQMAHRGAAATVAEFVELILESKSLAEAARCSGIDEQELEARLRSGSPGLFVMQLRIGTRFPSFQFREERLLPGISDIVGVVPDGCHPIEVSRWFGTTQPELTSDGVAVTPAEWLARGKSVAPVVALARRLDEFDY